MFPEELLITELLSRRPSRPRDFEAENRALGQLATAMARSPGTVLQKLAELALELTGAQSAGVSLVEDEGFFRWHATAGVLAPRLWELVPRDLSPCGDVLRRNQAMLIRNPVLRYPFIDPAIHEILLIPYYHGDDAVGTLWVVSHTPDKEFESEDARVIESVARFASAGTQNIENLDLLQHANERLKREIVEREQAEALLRESEAKHRFLAELAGATQTLTDPDEMMSVIARLLGQHLRADRCAYAEADERADYFDLGVDYSPELPSAVGRYRFSDFSLHFRERMLAGKPCVVDDIRDMDDTESHRQALRELRVRAFICMPIHKDGKLVALLGVHQKDPRRWMPSEIELVRLVADRSWESIERGRVLRRLRATDERVQMLIGHSIDFALIVSDIENRVVEWSGGATSITGWTEEEMLGRPASVIFTPEDIAAGAHEAELRGARENGRVADKRWHRRKDGSTFFADGVTVSLRGPKGELCGYGKVMRDATDRKRTEDQVVALLELEQKRSRLLREIAATSRSVNASLSIESIAHLIVQDARRLVGAHQAALTLTLGDECDQSINALSVSEKYDAYRGRVALSGFGLYSQVCRHNQAVRLTQSELEAHPDWRSFAHEPDGRLPLRGWLAVPMLSHGGANIGILQLSDKYEGEFNEEDEAILTQLAAVAAAGIQNAQLYDILREQDRRKDEFLATLAHELRNPLAPIRTGLEVIKLASNDSERSRVREMMERQLGHMVHLIDDLLDISRVSRGKVELKKERVDIVRVIHEAIETSLPLIKAAQHELSVKLPDEPLVLKADATRVTQIVSNLVNNAAKYTPKQGRVEISAHREDGHAFVCVKDNGIGIPRDMLSKIFDIFAQVGRPHGQTQGGLGIGLSLVKRLVEMHGGSVWADSGGLGHGSTFTVKLPLADGDGDRKPGSPAPEADEAVANDRLKVLVVDDNTDGAESLAMLMQMHGHECRAAYTGPSALETARVYRPDVIFLDIGLPGMSGYDVAQSLHRDRGGDRPVLVAVTGWGSEDDKRRAREAGFDHHLTKPIDVKDAERLLSCIVAREPPPAG